MSDAKPIATALKGLVEATFHMTDTNPSTGDRFPAAHRAARQALEAHESKKRLSLDELLETWSVAPPGTWENEHGPKDWYAVENGEGIVAYFSEEAAALRFRLAEINRALNG